jgi:tripartite-type tricarboxylate transporter receptor subunit TctC
MRSIRLLIPALAIGVGAIVCAVVPATGQSWPQRTVRVIVPNPPGVAMDIIARLFAERLATRWGNSVIVENLPGADGIPAAREFATRRDDHTLLYSFPGLITINPFVHEKLPYDPKLDLVPIASTSDNSLAIAVAATLKVGSLAELARTAKANRRKITWAATPGLPYYAFSAFQRSTGGDMVQAPYRVFNQAFVDLGEGRIDIIASGVLPLLSQARTGKIKLLAVLNNERASVAPEVPTVAEAGYPNLTFSAVTGFFGWRDIPSALRERIAADVNAIAADPAIRERLGKMGAKAKGSMPAEFASSIEEQRAKIAAIAHSLKNAK